MHPIAIAIIKDARLKNIIIAIHGVDKLLIKPINIKAPIDKN